MPSANVLFENLFEGTGYPTFDPWPLFDWPTGNNVSLGYPVVDGRQHGIGNRFYALLYRARSTQYPGRSDYKVDVTCRWKNPAYSTREVGLIVRFKDFNNCVIARLSSVVGGSPTLRLYKVIGGTATQLGSTWTGSDISGTKLAAGVQWRVRVQDLTDGSGNTKVQVFTESSLTDNGNLRIDWTGDLSEVRGNYTVGLELGSLVKGDDIYFSNLRVLDFADEWSAPAPAPGTGWQLELDHVLYSQAQLQALDPPIVMKKARPALGGHTCEVMETGKFHTGILRPNQPCRFWYDGKIVFDGVLVNANIAAAAESETRTFTGMDAIYLARQVFPQEDDCTGTFYFNVFDNKSDEFRPDRVNKTIGQIIQWFFDQNTEGVEKLRFYAAAPASGAAYVASDLNLLDAIIPDLALRGDFSTIIEQLLAYMPEFAIWVNPETRQWRFRKITADPAEVIALPNDTATFTIQPDASRPFTAIMWRGAKKESADAVTLSLSDGSAKPAWTKAQEDSWTKDKAKKSTVTLKIVSAGTYPVGQGPNGALVYVDVVIGTDKYQSQLDEDDFKGAVAYFDDDTYPRFVVKNTSGRISFSAPLWDGTMGGGPSTPPAPGSLVTLSLVDPQAAWWLSMQGVGRGVYLFPPVTFCPAYKPGGYGDHLKNMGQCGEALVTGTGDDGSGYAQQYGYEVKYPTQMQFDAGFCQPVAVLAEKPKPPVALINYFPPKGGSPPKGTCSPGQPPIQAMVDIQIHVSQTESCAPTFRLPETEGTFTGYAYSDNESDWGTSAKPIAPSWGVQRVMIVDDADFVDMSQAEGLKKSAQSWLNLYSGKFLMWNVVLASPWKAFLLDFPAAATTTRWQDLDKGISLTSTKRVTGYEDSVFPVLAVEFRIPENQTVIEAGTPSAYIKAEPKTLANTVSNKAAAYRAAMMLKRLEDFRNILLAKAADRVGGQQAGQTQGCDITVSDQNTRSYKSVEEDDQQKKGRQNYDTLRKILTDSLFHGIEVKNPGTPIEVPGLNDTQAQQVVPGAGPALGSWADHRIAFQGPIAGAPNSDRSKYGGLIGTENAEAGDSPEYLGKYGPFLFYAKPNAADTPAGRSAIQWSMMDGHGNPTTLHDYTGPQDLPDMLVPWSTITPGSIDSRLRSEQKEIARALGRVEDEVGNLLQPGNQPDSHPEGVPADLATMLRTPGFANPFLQVVPQSFGSPTGLIFAGPKTERGADAGLYWMVATPENLLVRVEPCTPGTGINGGSWDYAATGNGAALEYATALYCVHKQIHAKDLASAGMDSAGNPMAAASPPALSDDPFCLATQAGRELSATQTSGAGGRVSLPVGARGTPMFTLRLSEDPDGFDIPGRELAMNIGYSYRASPWSAAATTTTGTALKSDGSQTGTGQFKQPGGAIPPGLRVPTDAVVVGQTVPASSTMTGKAILGGIDVDIAVVEGGWWVRWREKVSVGSVWTHNHPWYSDVLSMADSWQKDFTKAWGEVVVIEDNWSCEVNPYTSFDELVFIADEWTAELIP